MAMYEIIEYYRGGGCKIVETGITSEQLEQKENEVLVFNRDNCTQNCYRAIVIDHIK